MEVSSDEKTRVIQVTNIAPQATRDQMMTLFAFIGKIEDLRLYPTVRDATMSVSARCCFVKFNEPSCVNVAQHLTNTVFIDRAIIVTPVLNGDVPEENEGMIMAAQFQQQGSCNGIVPLGSVLNGAAVSAAPVTTPDANLESKGLPPYPVLPVGTVMSKVDEIRRTVTIIGVDSTVSAQACMDLFSNAGEIKYFRFCTRPGDSVKYALIEFSDRSAVAGALEMNDTTLGMSQIKVTHSLQAISKPEAKSSEAVQKEIEEAMSRVKETQNLVSAAVDPLIGMLGGISSATSRSSRTRSRSRSISRRRSRSRDRHSSRRSRSRDRRRRSRSRSRDRRRSRSRDRRRRSRSRSRDKKRSRRSRSRDRKKRSRSRSRDKDRDRKKDKHKDKEREKEKEKEIESDGKAEKIEEEEEMKNAETEKNSQETASASEDGKDTELASTVAEDDKKRSRSRSRSRRRSRSREKRRRSRSRSRDRKRSRSRDRKSRRSSSRERRRKRSRSRKRKDRSKERKSSKKHSSKDDEKTSKSKDDSKTSEEISSKKESLETEDMEISNSP